MSKHHKHGKRTPNRREKRLESFWTVISVDNDAEIVDTQHRTARSARRAMRRFAGARNYLHHHEYTRQYDASGRSDGFNTHATFHTPHGKERFN